MNEDDLVLQMINAIDDLQIARGGTAKAEEEAFEALLQLRNDISEVYVA